MLEIDTDVLKGTIVTKVKGILNKSTVEEFNREINYLFYKQGFKYFIFDFREIERIEFDFFSWLENKLMEIFLSCGKVTLYGLKNTYEFKFDQFSNFREERQNFNFITI